MPTHDQGHGAEPAEPTLPPLPREELSLERSFIRRIKSVYTDTICETPELEQLLGKPLVTARSVAAVVHRLIGAETQECFLALLLNGKNRLSGIVEVSRGTLTASLVHPREVFASALTERAAAIIVAHNHPSGDPEPSAEDIQVTQRLKEAGTILGIPLLDHVVVGSAADRFVSLRERLKL